MAIKKIFDEDDDRYWLEQAVPQDFGPTPVNRMTPQDFPLEIGQYRGNDIAPVDPSLEGRIAETSSQLGTILSDSDARAQEQYRNNVYLATLPLAYSTASSANANRQGIGDNLMAANNTMYNTWNANDAAQINQMNGDQARIDQFVVNSRNAAVKDDDTFYSRRRDMELDEREKEKTAYERSKKDLFGLLDGKLVYKTPTGDLVYADGSDAAKDVDDPSDIRPVSQPTGNNFQKGTEYRDPKGNRYASVFDEKAGRMVFKDAAGNTVSDPQILQSLSIDSATNNAYGNVPSYGGTPKTGQETVDKLLQDAQTGRDTLITLDRIQSNLDNITQSGGGTGWWQQTVDPLAKGLSSIIGQTKDGELFGDQPERQQVDRDIAELKVQASALLRGQGGITDSERALLSSTLPSLGNNAEANTAIISVLKTVAERNARKADEWMAAYEQGVRDYNAWSAQWDRVNLPKDTPVATPNGEVSPTSRGAFPTPSLQAIELLKRDASPEALQEFDDIFGPGASKKVLGQ